MRFWTSTGAAMALALSGMAPSGANAQVAPPQTLPQTRTVPPVVLGPARPQRQSVPIAQPRPGEDRDGDGARYPADCDDGDAGRFPGNAETADDRDDDCNETTIGERDADYDGFTDYRVSNIASYGPTATTGLDCDDAQNGINPNAQELPNRLDDNCDGRVDNLLGTWWTPR